MLRFYAYIYKVASNLPLYLFDLSSLSLSMPLAYRKSNWVSLCKHKQATRVQISFVANLVYIL
jgi:hypothetical protein